MSDKSKPDEIAQGILEGIKSTKSDNPFLKKMQLKLAKSVYVRTGKDEALRELGLSYSEINEIERPRGKPSTNMYSDRQIVQLVFKQELQAGKPFTNAKSWENNPCFTAVADYQGRSVRQIREQWKCVPANERQKIRAELKATLEEHGLLHKRHR